MKIIRVPTRGTILIMKTETRPVRSFEAALKAHLNTTTMAPRRKNAVEGNTGVRVVRENVSHCCPAASRAGGRGEEVEQWVDLVLLCGKKTRTSRIAILVNL